VDALLLFLLLAPVLALAQAGPPAPDLGEADCRARNCLAPADPAPGRASERRYDSSVASPARVSPDDALAFPGDRAADRAARDTFPLQTAIAPQPPTEFQEFVAASIGRRLPLFGHDLFDHVPSTFAPADRIPVTGDYVLGPGDEIMLRVWGQIDLNARMTVDRDGQVFLPKVGSLTMAGLRYDQLSGFLRAALGRVFRNFDLTASLGQLRSIQIFVVGQARRPGAYTVSALSTLVNALFASGGPSPTGSMRRIQLKRDGRVLVEFDFYDLLLAGDKTKDTRLLAGDVIYIPPAGPSAAVAGSVKLPGIYELREGTTLGGAMAMAGGFSSTADGEKAILERIEDHGVRRVEEFPLDPSGLDRPLRDGDVVRVFSLSPRFENAVTLRGNVARPGRIQWHPGLRLGDVIPGPQALITREYWRAANASGNGPDPAEHPLADSPAGERPREETAANNAAAWGERSDAPVRPREAPASREESRDQEARSGAAPGRTATGGSAALPGKEATAATTARLRHQIARDAPEINWDYAVIQRLNPVDLSTRLIPFNLAKLVLEHDEASNLALEPGDIITVFSQNDLAVPLAKRSKLVRLEGEFRTAGVYRAEPGETVRHLVERAGGLTPNAYLFGAEFTRESARAEQQKGLDQLLRQLEEDITRGALAPAGITPDEVADQRARLEAQRQMVAKLGEIRASGRVVLDLRPASGSPADLPDIPLEDGDRLVVPYRPATVELLGAVYNRNSFLYRQQARVEDYLRHAGGVTRDADPGRMFIIRADGSIVSRQSVRGLWNGGFNALRLLPGDAIVVPERLSHGSFLRGLRDWSQIFSQFALGAAAVRVIQ
jgi:protein involved in polysaccharide export with SLBB domain